MSLSAKYQHLNSVRTYKQHGLTPSTLAYMIQSLPKVPEHLHDTLECYYLKYWSPMWFFKQMVNGTIEADGIKYQVIYRGTDPYALKRTRQVKLSFRKPKAEGIAPIVLVTAAT